METTTTPVQGYVAMSNDGAFADKVCGACAIDFAATHLGVMLTLDDAVSWENEYYTLYEIIDGDSESYAVNGYGCESCGVTLDLRPWE